MFVASGGVITSSAKRMPDIRASLFLMRAFCIFRPRTTSASLMGSMIAMRSEGALAVGLVRDAVGREQAPLPPEAHHVRQEDAR